MSVEFAAASARLCVETRLNCETQVSIEAAASARLCVETAKSNSDAYSYAAAASARLCVETTDQTFKVQVWNGSRLRAAVC